jgi:hypothetical protein
MCSIVARAISRAGSELPGEELRERAHLERRSSTARVDRVKLDRVQLMVGENRDQVAGLQLCGEGFA